MDSKRTHGPVRHLAGNEDQVRRIAGGVEPSVEVPNRRLAQLACLSNAPSPARKTSSADLQGISAGGFECYSEAHERDRLY
jgi:hypothetical protein